MYHTDYYYILHESSTEKIGETIETTRPVSVDIQLALYDIFIPILGILIISLNFIIVITSGLILRKGQQPRSTYIFLGNVALSDLILGITLLFGQYYPIKLCNEIICCIIMGCTVSSIVSSVYSVMLIGIDRYMYILNGLHYKKYLYSKRARILVLVTWIFGIFIGFLPLMGYRNSTDNGRLCWFVLLAPPELVIFTTTIGILPLAIIIVLYSIILKRALHKVKELKEAAKNEQGAQNGRIRIFRGGQHSRTSSLAIISDQTLNRAKEIVNTPQKHQKVFQRSITEASIKIAPVYNPSKWKAIKIVLYTAGAYFITWFPYFLASTLFVLCDPEETPKYCDNLRIAIASPLGILGFTNSLLNPVIYAWWHNGFRESMKKIYRGVFWNRRGRENCSLSDTIKSKTSDYSKNDQVNTPEKLSKIDENN